MAEIILPFCRTIFLPAGSPGISSINQVRGDLRNLRCGSAGGEVYCIGEADILVDYISYMPGRNLGPFAVPSTEQQPGCDQAWQALLTLPFQLSGCGELPADGPYRVELGDIEWCMVAARALEVETTVIIHYEPVAQPTAAEYWQPDMTTSMEAAEINEGGGWTMVSLEDEQYEQTGYPEQDVEIVNFGEGADEEDIRAAIVQALAEADESIAACRNVWEKYTGNDQPSQQEMRKWLAAAEEAAAMATQAMQSDSAAGEQPQDFTIRMTFPRQQQADQSPAEAMAAMLELAEDMAETMAGMMMAEDAPAPEETAMSVEPEGPEIVSLSEEETQSIAGQEMWTDDAAVDAEFLATEEPEAAEPVAAALTPEEEPQLSVRPVKAVVVPDTTSATALAPEQAPAPKPEMARDIAAAMQAQTEAEPERKQRKRRFQGLPGVAVQASNNDIDITGFQINIRL